jgi:hypothetical protein
VRRRLAPALAAVAALPLAAPAAQAAPWSFPRAPTDQLGVAGARAGWEITPGGGLYWGPAELGFRSGPTLARWDVRTRTLASGRYPVYRSRRTAGGVTYAVTHLADRVGGVPVAFVVVDVRNATRRTRRARWASGVSWTGGSRYHDRWGWRYVRPSPAADAVGYDQPGEAFSPSARYALRGRDVLRDGRVLAVVPPGAARRAAGPAGGRLTATAQAGRVAYELKLRPGQRRRLVFRVPLEPLAASDPALPAVRAASPDAARARVLGRWRATLGRAARIDVPEPKAEQAWYASLTHMLTARSARAGGTVQTVNLLNYHAFWLRDGAMFAHAYELAGLEPEARATLAWFARTQRPDGLFISRPEQHDGFGQALWGYAEYARRAGGAAYATAVLPRIERAMDWLRAARAKDALHLLPPTDSYDNELVAGHITGDNFWALAGARGAAALARRAGRADLAERWDADAGDLQAALGTALATATTRTGGWIPPALDASGGQDWGNLWAAWPLGVLGPRDPRVTATLAHVRRRFRQGIATYYDGTVLHGYLGFRVWETELLRGDQGGVVRGLFAALAHTSATDGGFEFNAPDNLLPHGWWAAEYVALLRNMLVRESGTKDVRLLSAVPAQWLAPGKRIAVAGAPTARGPVTFAVRGTLTGAVVTWRTRLAPGTRLLLTLPGKGTRAVTLTGARGTRRVTWARPRPAATWTGTVRALRAELRR